MKYPEHVMILREYLVAITSELVDLLCSKAIDYGEYGTYKFGEEGILIRLSDKVDRLINIRNREVAVKDETIEDTWLDIAGYALLALVERRKKRYSEEDA